MKIKELQKTVNIAWSPAQQDPIYLAAGSAAQEIDTSLNSSSTLELYSINLSDPGYDLICKASQTTRYKFHKLAWSPLGMNANHPNGVIAAGCEGGHLQVYSASKLLAGEDALLSSQDKHTGAVRALDYNPFQANLLASGASESDILIWALNNTTTPMTPGTKTQPLEDIQNIAWNRQVQHILASVFSTRCVVWDLRKNEPIIKLSDSQSRVRFRALQWHPKVATQLWLASEDDQSPVVQLWDLRYATAPAKTLQIHQRGILALAWCLQDTDLMVSTGKDNKILCWNPNAEQGEEILSEVAHPIQWYSDVLWCPRNPALIASSSLEGNVSIYSLFGGSQQQVQTTNKIADSFPGMDTFAQAPAPSTTHVVYSDLKKPPKWMKQPVGARFGFGGRLFSFRNDPNAATRTVTVSQVITEPELVERSTQLEQVLANGNFSEYCRQKADETQDQHNRYVWYFLKANFEQDPRSEMLNLLGYNKEDMDCKFGKIIDRKADDLDVINNKLADLGRSDSSEVEGDYIASISTTTNDSTDFSTTDNAAVFDNIGVNQKLKLDDINDEIPYKIRTGEDNEGLICQALLTGNIEAAVDLCLESNRTADAIIIATTGGSELLARTQYRYLKKSQGYLANIISALVTDDWSSVIAQCTSDSWKEALVATLTHCHEHAPALCERLGERLQSEGGTNLTVIQSAILCYICAGNVEKLADTWLATHAHLHKNLLDSKEASSLQPSTKELQDLIEVVMLFQKALELQGRSVTASGKLADVLSQYAALLAAQGALSSALTYLGPSDDPEIVELRERLYYSLGHKQAYASRTSSQTQSYYAKSQTPNNYMQQRTSLTNNSFGLPAAGNFTQQQPSLFQSNIAPAMAPMQSWNNPNSPQQSTGWNSNAISQVTPNINPLLPPVTSKPPIGPPQNDNLPHPPRPSSVSSQGSAPVRSKYLIDPSVQSGSAYGQTSNLFTPQTVNNAQQFGSQNYNQFAPQPFNSTPAAPLNPFTPFNPNSTAAPVQPSILNPPPLNNYVPGVAPIEVAQSALQQPLRNPTPPPGWNDPPALKSNRKASIPPQDPNNVITHPLFGQDPTSQYGQNGYVDNTSVNSYQQRSPFVPGAPQQQQPHQMPPTQFQAQPIQSQPYLTQQQPMQPVARQTPTPEPPKPKQPLPEEYVYLQTVFNELRTQCINNASNPQIKRKLDDVAKRLEFLYDMLREHRLTPNTLASLNQLVQLVQIGDYTAGLGLHTQMVSGPDFSQIASFMPGIKVLLQTAMQLQVYLR